MKRFRNRIKYFRCTRNKNHKYMPYNMALHNCKQKDKKYNLKDIIETKIQPRTQMEIHEMQKKIRKRNKERAEAKEKAEKEAEAKAEREKIKGLCDGLNLDSLTNDLKKLLPPKPCNEMTQKEYNELYQVLYNLRTTKEFKAYFNSLGKSKVPYNPVIKNGYFPE